MARAVGIAPSTYQEYEDGALPNAVTGGALERALGVEPYSIYREALPVSAEAPSATESAA